MPVRRLLAAIGTSVVVVAVACGDFGSDDTPDRDGGPTGDRDLPNDDGGPLADGSTDAAPLADPRLPCPPPRITLGPSPARAVLVEAPTSSEDVEYPFEIAVDERYVFWVAQHTDRALNPARNAYDGLAAGRLHRTEKDKTGVLNASTLLVSSSFDRAQALALDGPYVYFTAYDDEKTLLLRVRRDCSAPCEPEQVHAEIINNRVTRIRRAAPGLLFLQYNDGVTHRFDIANQRWSALTPHPRANSDVEVTGDAVYLSSAADLRLLAFEHDGRQGSELGIPDAGVGVGASRIATNCADVFGWRGDMAQLWWSRRAEGPLTFLAKIAPAPLDVFDLAADEGHVYSGCANSQGLWETPADGGTSRRVAQGSFWGLALDETGIYTGDHTKNVGGAIYRIY